MRKLAYRDVQDLAEEEYGYVTGRENDTYQVRTISGMLNAKRAVSCIIEPEAGDKVLVCTASSQKAYILAILERETTEKYRVTVPGDLTIASSEGSLEMQAKQAFRIKSQNAIEMSSRHLKSHFETGDLIFNRLNYVGQIVQATLSHIKTVAHVVESIADRFQQLVKNSYRTIEESEHIKAGTFHCMVDKLLSMRGKYTVVTAKTDVKINGKHIHMG